ncbi:hypothetical protein [Kitasatospora sp. LaBMicrA B282]|uniref:hypothetical protein n=1 Tax=Kitasatospora sp. LaBMicrA B282 TaxID=3420949 RepID=UPI003D0CA02D
MDGALPEGWTIERVRAESGDTDACLLSGERFVVIEDHRRAEYVELPVEVVLSFSGLCLALAEGEWFMGDLDTTDGSLVCWASYGPDLGKAIEGL